jgi:hypothetical protein
MTEIMGLHPLFSSMSKGVSHNVDGAGMALISQRERSWKLPENVNRHEENDPDDVPAADTVLPAGVPDVPAWKKRLQELQAIVS